MIKIHLGLLGSVYQIVCPSQALKIESGYPFCVFFINIFFGIFLCLYRKRYILLASVTLDSLTKPNEQQEQEQEEEWVEEAGVIDKNTTTN